MLDLRAWAWEWNGNYRLGQDVEAVGDGLQNGSNSRVGGDGGMATAVGGGGNRGTDGGARKALDGDW